MSNPVYYGECSDGHICYASRPYPGPCGIPLEYETIEIEGYDTELIASRKCQAKMGEWYEMTEAELDELNWDGSWPS